MSMDMDHVPSLPPLPPRQPQRPGPAATAVIQQAVARVPVSLQDANFLPWVGEHYGQSGLFGPRKILVVGESHYAWEEDAFIDPTLTCWCIAGQLTGEDAPKAYWTNVVIALRGRHPASAEKLQAWHAMAYYTYVQQIVGAGPRQRPTRAMWTASHAAFRSVLAALQPDVVLVLGVGVWDHLPAGTEELPALTVESGLRATLPAGSVTLRRRM